MAYSDFDWVNTDFAWCQRLIYSWLLLSSADDWLVSYFMQFKKKKLHLTVKQSFIVESQAVTPIFLIKHLQSSFL